MIVHHASIAVDFAARPQGVAPVQAGPVPRPVTYFSGAGPGI